MTRGRRSGSAVLAGLLAGTLLAACSDRAARSTAADPARSTLRAATEPPSTNPAAPLQSPFVASPPETANELTGQILLAERAIADPTTSERMLRNAGRSQQVAYRVLASKPHWDEKVIPRLPRDLRPVARAHVAARREFRSMHPRSSLSDTLPAWRIVEPATAPRLLRFYRRAEAAYRVGWEYLAAINLVETGMGRIRGTSVAGAQGPMQFIPSTWARWGRGDVNDPADAIMAAARYLAHNGFAQPGGIPGALYRYNNSRAYVRGVTHYARLMERRPRTFHGLYHWQIYYATTEGDVLLPVGYERTRPVPVERYLATHRQG